MFKMIYLVIKIVKTFKVDDVFILTLGAEEPLKNSIKTLDTTSYFDKVDCLAKDIDSQVDRC